MVKRNDNFSLEPQEATLLYAASECYKKVTSRHLAKHSGAGSRPWDDTYDSNMSLCEELGRFAGLTFRAAEKFYPWPGASITEELREEESNNWSQKIIITFLKILVSLLLLGVAGLAFLLLA